MNIRCLSLILCFLSFIIHRQSYVFCSGIATSFVDVVVSELSIDNEYNFTVLSGRSLQVINRGDKQINVTITPQVPQYNLKVGSEPIPDINWVKIVPDNYKLETNQTGISDVFIKIPKDKTLRGRTFQFNIEICGYPLGKKDSISLVPALLSKVRFTIKKKKTFLLW